MANKKQETFEFQEPLEDLIQMSDAELQTLDDGILARLDELLKENNIDEDDVVEFYSGVTVSYTIIYKKGKNNE